MEFERYLCSSDEAAILGNALYKLAKDTNSYSSFKGYSSNPEVMLCTYRFFLSSDMGLDFNYYNYYNKKYEFNILDKKKFLVAKIKYEL